ncbi:MULTISPECIES: glycosyl hydrolase family 28-related protein [unclassified Kribbella]|uniref:glycosyl hydrolase family 28-related protein n=1 Tax=unclassified Kribbella TaxID=2644121 RepID=UPI0030196ACF
MLSRRQFTGLAAGAVAGSFVSTAVPAVATADQDPVRFTSAYQTRPPDPGAVLLGSPGFEVHGDGIGDDTAAVRAAVDEASRRGIANKLGDILGGVRDFPLGDGGGVVLVPPGTYRLTGPIDVHDSVRIIGYGVRRPRFVLADNSPGYDGSTPRDVFSFRRRPVGGPVTYANNDTFGSGLMNLDIAIGAGNPQAIAVRFGGAQLCVLQDLDIDTGDGWAGIDHNANLIQRVRVSGGAVGLNAFAASAGWQTTLLDCRFTGQRETAIRTNNDAKLVLVRTVLADAPRGVECVPDQFLHLYLQSCLLSDLTDSGIVLNDSDLLPGATNPLIRNSNQLNLVDSICRRTPTVLTLAQTGSRTHASDGGIDLTYGLRIANALSTGETRINGVQASYDGRRDVGAMLHSDVPDLPPVSTWVSITEVAARMGRTVGRGTEDDLAVFQAAVDRHETVFVPIGEYLLAGTLRLGHRTNLIGLHPRQTWLRTPDGTPCFGDPERPKALVETPPGGRNIVVGLGLDTARNTPGSVNIRWQSGSGSYLADITTQFVKWHPEDVASGDPGYTYRGKHKYGVWVRGGGGVLSNIWSGNGWADNGLLVEHSTVPTRAYEVSVEHHQFREVVLRHVANWEFLGLQTEDHIYGWQSQAVELDHCLDLLFANSVFFRVATVLGPSPYGVGLRSSRNIVFRGNRGYRDKTPGFTQWGVSVADVRTGRTVPDLEFALIDIP